MPGIVVLFVLPERIEDARWLTPEEAREARKAVDDDYAKREQTAHISVSQIFTHRYV